MVLQLLILCCVGALFLIYVAASAAWAPQTKPGIEWSLVGDARAPLCFRMVQARALHRCAGVPPTGAGGEMGPHGSSLHGLTLDATHLRCGGESIALARVLGVHAQIWEREHAAGAELRVLTPRGIATLRAPCALEDLEWFAEQMGSMCRRRRGGQVPEALLALVAGSGRSAAPWRSAH